MCNPRLCNDSQACCAVTIFSVLLILFLGSVSSPSLALALTRPRPHSPSPSLALALTRPRPHSPSPSLALALVHSRHHRSSPPPPSTIAATSSRQRTDVQRQHTGIYASPSPHLCVLRSSGSQPFSLSLPLLSPGEHPQTRHAGTVLHYSSMPFPVASGINLPALECILSA